MIVVVRAEGTELLDPDVFTALSVRSTLPAPELADAVARHGVGRLDDDAAHVWLEPALLHRGPGEARERAESVAGLLAFAAGRGWVDDEGRVRAHLEQPTA